MLVYFQLASAVLCTFAAGWNFQQARHYVKKCRELHKQYKPIAQVIVRFDGERQLGMIGTLPEPGSTLYVLEKPPAKVPAHKVITA